MRCHGCETKFFLWQGRPAGTPGRLGEASPPCVRGIMAHTRGSPHEAVDEDDLAEAEESQRGPGEGFAPAQTGLADGREGELNLQGANGNDIAATQDGVINLVAIDGTWFARPKPTPCCPSTASRLITPSCAAAMSFPLAP